MKFNVSLAIAAACTSTFVSAQTERDLDSHQHGAATINVALVDKSILVELDTPWNNILGFEHAPETNEQQKMVDDALAHLSQPSKLFSFVGANCVGVDTYIETNLAVDSHDDDHDKEHANGDDHDDDHDKEHAHGDDHDDDHDKEHAHGDDHDDHAGEEGSHSSVLATYTFECDKVSNATAMNVDLLTHWSGFEAVSVQMIGPNGQAATTIGPQQIRVDLTPIQ